MAIRVCVAGATGFVGSCITRRILESGDFQLVGAIARRDAGRAPCGRGPRTLDSVKRACGNLEPARRRVKKNRGILALLAPAKVLNDQTLFVFCSL